MALFRSNYKGFRLRVRDEIPDRHQLTGNVIGVKERRLAAEFALFGPETQIFNPETGGVETVADIYGGFYDTVAAQERLGWTDEERDAVEASLRHEAELRPDHVREIVAVHVASPAPWANYDEADAKDVPKLADALGLIPETVRYERENLNRAAVLEPLTAKMEGMDEDTRARANPLFQIPASDFSPPQGGGIHLQPAPQFTPGGIPVGTPGIVSQGDPLVAEV